MSKLRSILWATDFHPESKVITQVVVDLAWRFDSQVTLFHVVPDSGSPVSNDHRRVLGRELIEKLTQELQSQKVIVRESSVVTGSAADRILRRANEVNADLILLGAGEQTQPGRFVVVGPTATAIIEHAHQPVMAVVPGESPPTFRRILCPIDFSTTSQRGLSNAIQLAKAFRGQLIVGTVFPSGGWVDSLLTAGSGFDVDEKAEQDWRAEFETLIGRTDFGGVGYFTDLRRGVPHEQIAAMAVEHACDMLVMGATGRTGLARLLMGSVTRRVLQQLPCSVVIVHDEDILVEAVTDDDLRNSQLLYAEAAALLAVCDYTSAIWKFDQVLARNPFFIEALEGRATACERLGQPDRAARCRHRIEIIRTGMPATKSH